MQKIFFAIGHFIETCLSLLVGMGWLPNILISITLFIGLIYWLNLQGKYNKKAQKDSTLA
ncbi:MAG: hypothetical protein WAR83_15750 [Flavobacteriales bacterium]|nr:hypothetical protein [Flavobacteriales bacterium]